jgi:hypothetical protein
MKYLRLFILFVIGFLVGMFVIPRAKAECQHSTVKDVKNIKTQTPEFLQDALITIILKNGSMVQMSANEYMVVPRQQTVDVNKEIVTCNDPAPAKKYSSRVSLLGGYGAQEGLKRANGDNPGEATVESRVGIVGGVMGQQMLTERLSIGVQLQTNKTGLGVIGLDW